MAAGGIDFDPLCSRRRHGIAAFWPFETAAVSIVSVTRRRRSRRCVYPLMRLWPGCRTRRRRARGDASAGNFRASDLELSIPAMIAADRLSGGAFKASSLHFRPECIRRRSSHHPRQLLHRNRSLSSRKWQRINQQSAKCPAPLAVSDAPSRLGKENHAPNRATLPIFEHLHLLGDMTEAREDSMYSFHRPTGFHHKFHCVRKPEKASITRSQFPALSTRRRAFSEDSCQSAWSERSRIQVWAISAGELCRNASG